MSWFSLNIIREKVWKGKTMKCILIVNKFVYNYLFGLVMLCDSLFNLPSRIFGVCLQRWRRMPLLLFSHGALVSVTSSNRAQPSTRLYPSSARVNSYPKLSTEICFPSAFRWLLQSHSCTEPAINELWRVSFKDANTDSSDLITDVNLAHLVGVFAGVVRGRASPMVRCRGD